ncbi:MAG: F0F1 ATP synthase subunit epsilon, partial [Blastocatellia bacterium]|nr:F0F1 ATP synthase subunit epsilon [Blastocatellia bacterium]
TRALIGQGFVEINSDKVTILAGLAEMPNEINLELARKDLESAERSLKAAEKDPDIDIQEALIRVERAMIRSQIAEKS